MFKISALRNQDYFSDTKEIYTETNDHVICLKTTAMNSKNVNMMQIKPCGHNGLKNSTIMNRRNKPKKHDPK